MTPTLSCSLCDTFMRRNVNISRDDEIARWPGIVAAARAAGPGSPHRRQRRLRLELRGGVQPRAADGDPDANVPLVETFQEARHFGLGADAFQREVRPWREPIPSARPRAQA